MTQVLRSHVAGSAAARSTDAPGSDAVPGGGSSLDGSYPGGKSGAGIFQRLINLIPRHKIFVSAFAGRCGVTRNIRPAEHTIVIDADERVCQWWDSWRRTKVGRDLEMHHCDSIEWLRFRFGQTEYSAAGSSDATRCDRSGDADESSDRGSRTIPRPVMAIAADDGDAAASSKTASTAVAAQSSDGRLTHGDAAEYFVFCDRRQSRDGD